MTVHVAERIENGSLVTEVYGGWPSFHDAEVKHLALAEGSTVEAAVQAFEITRETTEHGYLRLDNHRLVTLRFTGARNIELAGWDMQNPVMGISFDYLDEDEGNARWRIYFEGASTFGMEFECDKVTVVSVEPTTVESPELSAADLRERVERRRAATKRPTLAEQVELVSDRATFMEFVELLIEDRVAAVKSGDGDWRNTTISEYLAGAVQSAREWEPHGTWGLREEPNWHDFAWFLLVGRN